ncbi:PREDICTED: adenylate isopentenyltransferase 6, chloroplastic-like [Camelina sativa]|uniref:Adenylate isopentenyltransferase 6, chloroplastic-like n=1 Tax=Camelina sativa TaxID=90675 RepID=A0ABM0VS97_CAMSA|nr:PREDICTED: adenylate isopentenyltransferase 6, chloroplastic-like [Camelina sativa]
MAALITLSSFITLSSSFFRFPLSTVTTISQRPRSVTMCMGKSGPNTPKDKVVLITGTTGTGKSRLSVDLANHFSGEIATNLIPLNEQGGVPHHLLGDFRPEDGELSPGEFRSLATLSIAEVVSRGKLPIIVGGSNSFNHALLAERFDPTIDPFAPSSSLSTICADLRYKCCIFWVDVSEPVLFQHLRNRVDKMIESGLFEQLAAFYDPIVDLGPRLGVRKTIGVEEFDRYFRVYLRERNTGVWDLGRKAAYEEAVKGMKERTCLLVKKQKEKIIKLIRGGWEIKRLDATAAIMAELNKSSAALGEGRSSSEIWQKDIVEESVETVNSFLLQE